MTDDSLHRNPTSLVVLTFRPVGMMPHSIRTPEADGDEMPSALETTALRQVRHAREAFGSYIVQRRYSRGRYSRGRYSILSVVANSI